MSKLDFFKTKKGLLTITVAAIIVGFLIGDSYRANEVRKAISAITNNTDLSTQNESMLEHVQNVKGILINKNIGDLIELATINFKVIKSEESNMTNDGTPIVAPKDSKFVFVTLEAVNTTKNAYNFPFDFPALIDDQERSFMPYSGIGDVKNYLDYRTMAPGITENGVLTYQIPTNAEHYYLIVAKGGTEDYTRIKLK